MITREQCIPGTIVRVNDRITKSNSNLYPRKNGLMCHLWNEEGSSSIVEIEIGSELEILSEPHSVNGSGTQVKFRFNGLHLGAWWTVFKSKVDL